MISIRLRLAAPFSIYFFSTVKLRSADTFIIEVDNL